MTSLLRQLRSPLTAGLKQGRCGSPRYGGVSGGGRQPADCGWSSAVACLTGLLEILEFTL